MVEERQGNLERKPAHLPQGLAAVETERAEAIRRGEPLQACALEPAPPPQIAHVAISLGGEIVADRDEALRVILAQAVDLAKAEAKCKFVLCLRSRASRYLSAGCLRYRASRYLSAGRLERAVPLAPIDVGLARLDAVRAGATHDLRRRVEAHRLRIEERGGKGGGVMAFEPGRDIDEMGEASGMALGEAVFAETFDLVEATLGEIGRIAARGHAADHLFPEAVDRATAAERRHGAPELVCLRP